jgi:hypothetical protein
MSKKPTEVTRYISPRAEKELWARAAGRCEFSGCNELLYKSPVTQERVNIAQMAHIYSFSPAGPRGRGHFAGKTTGLNDVGNLMLVCYGCHRKIDQDKGGNRYSPELLKRWKEEHEVRIRIVTGISPNKKSHVILYGSRIGDENSPLSFDAAAQSMFPDWLPAEDRAVSLSMACSHDDSAPEFLSSEATHLRREFERQIRSRSEEAKPNHFSVFGLASQPLLVLLGALLTDKVPAVVYQLHREPVTWKWQDHLQPFGYGIISPAETDGTPVLIIALSAKIRRERISSVLPGKLSIWELTIDKPSNDFLHSQLQLSMFRQVARKLIGEIEAIQPKGSELQIFPAMPVACAVELGRIRMPKADRPWQIYDQNNKHGKFIPALKIGADHE